jgi:hypothetical protein
LRSAIALVTGVASCVAHPAASNPAVATDTWMKARLVSFIQESPWPLLESTCHAENRAMPTLDMLQYTACGNVPPQALTVPAASSTGTLGRQSRDWANYLLRCNMTY